jgi:hypothetical protein
MTHDQIDVPGSLTPQQAGEVARIVGAYEAVVAAARSPRGAPHAQEHAAVRVAALEHVVGSLDLAGRGRALREARAEAERMLTPHRMAMRAGAVVAVLSGAMTEVSAAQSLGVARSTVRDAMRKKSR